MFNTTRLALLLALVGTAGCAEGVAAKSADAGNWPAPYDSDDAATESIADAGPAPFVPPAPPPFTPTPTEESDADAGADAGAGLGAGIPDPLDAFTKLFGFFLGTGATDTGDAGTP